MEVYITVWQLVLFSIIALSANFDYGFSSTYLNNPVDQFKIYLNESWHRRGHQMYDSTYNWIWNLILNIWFVGFFLGIWASPLLNDRFGRRVGYIVGNGFAFVGSVLRYLGILLYLPEMLLAGRFLTSICIAITYQSCILFLQECSPTHLRGFLSFLSEISFAVMCLIGAMLGTEQLLANHLQILLLVPVPLCFFFFVVLFFIHETPKFLLIVRKDRERAEKSVLFYHGEHANVRNILNEIESESQEEADNSWLTLKEILTTKHLRDATILSCCALQNTIALWSLLLSSTYFLKQANVNSNVAAWSSTSMTLAYVVGTLIGSALIEKVGRRGLLLFFIFCNNLFLVMFVICSQLQVKIGFLRNGCLFSLIAYGFTYGAGVGPISWFISSELVPQKYRSMTQSLCYAINTIFVVITTFSILPLYNLISSYSFLALYTVPNLFCLVHLYRKLPETRGREIHDIVSELKGKI
ncbi:unnamed protein product [Auanema sp. JU1783]|nr:unnamed protein product [Auanema sp. JU1783]